MTRTGLITATLLVLAPTARAGDKEDERKAELLCQSLLQACEAFEIHPSNPTKTYPKTLAELVKPPFGGPSFLRNGEKDLIGPWGKVPEYDVMKDMKGNRRAYIWFERTVDGKMKVIGFKSPKT